MIDEECKLNRVVFSEEENAKKLEFLPNKYVPKYIEQDREGRYDHPLMYRGKEYDYLFVSIYGTGGNTILLSEGFRTVPPMYNTMCRTFMKKFYNTKTSKIKEVPWNTQEPFKF